MFHLGVVSYILVLEFELFALSKNERSHIALTLFRKCMADLIIFKYKKKKNLKIMIVFSYYSFSYNLPESLIS